MLVIGGGGREHALCYALRRSPSCSSVFCAPGNAGIDRSGDATVLRSLDISNHAAVAAFCQSQGVGLVVVGPEAPLVSGLVDYLTAAGIPTFGPSKRAAALEGSKDFMKRICDKYNIPTAKVVDGFLGYMLLNIRLSIRFSSVSSFAKGWVFRMSHLCS